MPGFAPGDLMTIAIHSADHTASVRKYDDVLVRRLPGIATAAVASVGAGVVHAGAIGIHAEHPGLARLFIAVACFQLGWGLITLFKPSRWMAAIGVVGNLIAVSVWLLTRLMGVSFIEGLEVREAAQFTDTATAALGLVAAGLALGAALIGWRKTRPNQLSFPSLAVFALALPALITGSSHVHSQSVAAGTDAAVHDHATPAVTGGDAVAHDHGTPAVGAPNDTTHADHTPAAVPTVKYDPTKPIDLGGVPGVTPEQQATAENLVAITLIRLPNWSDPATAEAAGFHSIGDGFTGFEHYIQWDWINDDITLNPDFPESLVFTPQPDGTKKLVSAMFLLPDTVALDQVPVLGGPLTQFHIHDNLCFTLDPVAPQVRGLTDAAGNCPSTLQKFRNSPMIHVWIVPQDCGPFSALEGVGAGQVAEGQTKNCDYVHGTGF